MHLPALRQVLGWVHQGSTCPALVGGVLEGLHNRSVRLPRCMPLRICETACAIRDSFRTTRDQYQ